MKNCKAAVESPVSMLTGEFKVSDHTFKKRSKDHMATIPTDDIYKEPKKQQIRSRKRAVHIQTDDNEYEIEKIIGQRVHKGKKEVLVKWLG
jgi:hypothetical protein